MNEPISQRPAMSSYGVPDELEGVLSWSWALERLAVNRNFWLTHVDAQGLPHSMPLWGVWDAAANVFWFSTATESFRVRNLATNPAVVVAVDHTVEVVSIEGKATRVDPSSPEVAAMAAAWGAKYGEAREGVDVAQAAAELTEFFSQGAVFRVDPVKGFGLIERPEDFGPTATRWVFPAQAGSE